MSNYIYLWDAEQYGLPKTLEEAQTIFTRLCDGVKAKPSSHILAFSQAIESLVKNSPEPDSDLILRYGDFVKDTMMGESALLVVDLPPSQTLEVLRMIVETATTLPLVVFADLLSVVFLPHSKVLPEDKAILWQETLEDLDKPHDFPRTKTSFRKLVEPIFDAVRVKHNFYVVYAPNRTDPNFVVAERSIPMGKQKISISYEGGDGYLKMAVTIYVECDLVTQIYQQFQFANPPTLLRVELTHIFLNLKRPEHLEITNRPQLQLMLALIEKTIFPILNMAQDIKGMDKLMNGDIDESITYSVHNLRMPQSLIIARLAGNPHFEELVVKLEKGTGWGVGAIREAKLEKWAKLVKYLREEVKPLV